MGNNLGAIDIVVEIVIVLVITIASYVISRLLIAKALSWLISDDSDTDEHDGQRLFDNVLRGERVFRKFAYIPPGIVAYFAIKFLLQDSPQVGTSDAVSPDVVNWLQRIALCYLVVVTVWALEAILDSIVGILENASLTKGRTPLRGFFQAAELLLFVVGAVLFFSALLYESPLNVLAGIGALTAVLMLIFKDSLVGLVACAQIVSNKLVQVDDAIEFPKYGADGVVQEIGLHTVKVQNFDRTETIIPTVAFVADGYKNWRNISGGNARRIKRAIIVDMTTIRFLDAELLERLDKIALLHDYLQSKQAELAAHNAADDGGCKINRRNLTNIGTFRVYIEAYLSQPALSDIIHQDGSLTLLVRQLAPTENGLPLEIMCYAKKTGLADFERIQADIFDHLLSVDAEFGLRAFQVPSGYDVAMSTNHGPPPGQNSNHRKETPTSAELQQTRVKRPESKPASTSSVASAVATKPRKTAKSRRRRT